MAKRAHPAHRMSQYGPTDNRPSPIGEELDKLITELSAFATPSETPGAHRDELTETIIMAARQWVAREMRSSRWSEELDMTALQYRKPIQRG